MSPSVAKQAEQLKQEGNHCFVKNRFGAAIDAYTEVFLFFCKFMLIVFPPSSSFNSSFFLYSHPHFRQLRFALTYPYTGPIGLCVTESASMCPQFNDYL